KDAQNMGACMAPAAADVIYQHFKDFNSTPADYDKIITGDLGLIGKVFCLNYLRKRLRHFGSSYGLRRGNV
ncbi:Stage V sporulation AD, partial [human gut metagenome]